MFQFEYLKERQVSEVTEMELTGLGYFQVRPHRIDKYIESYNEAEENKIWFNKESLENKIEILHKKKERIHEKLMERKKKNTGGVN